MIKLNDTFTSFRSKDGQVLIYNTPATTSLSSVLADFELGKPEVLCNSDTNGQFIYLESEGWVEYKSSEQHSFKLKSDGQIHVIRREGDKLYWNDKSSENTFKKLGKLPKVKSVLRSPINREVELRLQLPDGRFIIVTQEEQDRRHRHRMFIGDGRTMEELAKADYVYGGNGTMQEFLHVDSADGRVSIYYNKHRGNKITDNIGEIYWTPRGPWNIWCYAEGDPVPLKLLTPKQCSVDLGLNGKVRSVKRA
jgi:hypothetical protein